MAELGYVDRMPLPTWVWDAAMLGTLQQWSTGLKTLFRMSGVVSDWYARPRRDLPKFSRDRDLRFWAKAETKMFRTETETFFETLATSPFFSRHDDDQFNSRTYSLQLEQTSRKFLALSLLITFSAIKQDNCHWRQQRQNCERAI